MNIRNFQMGKLLSPISFDRLCRCEMASLSELTNYLAKYKGKHTRAEAEIKLVELSNGIVCWQIVTDLTETYVPVFHADIEQIEAELIGFKVNTIFEDSQIFQRGSKYYYIKKYYNDFQIFRIDAILNEVDIRDHFMSRCPTLKIESVTPVRVSGANLPDCFCWRVIGKQSKEKRIDYFPLFLEDIKLLRNRPIRNGDCHPITSKMKINVHQHDLICRFRSNLMVNFQPA